jgi:hypothetical protein
LSNKEKRHFAGVTSKLWGLESTTANQKISI